MRRYHTIATVLTISSLLLISCGGSGIGGSSDQEKDPVVVDHPIAYIKQPIPEDIDYSQPSSFYPGSDLYLRQRASPSAAESNITRQITSGTGSVKDLEVSYDGTRLIFSLKLAEIDGAEDDEQPKWNIWEYEIDTQILRRIITTDITTELGHDVAPHYLPDGRIVFSSTRQRRSKAVLLDEGKPQFEAMIENGQDAAFVLHVMNDDGSDIHQISFNPNHDLDPTVLQNGKILFSRRNQAGLSLYTIRPDGTELEYLYGSNSHETGSVDSTVEFLHTREMQNGRILSMLKPFEETIGSGNLIQIDTNNYVDNLSPTWSNIGVINGQAQSSATVNSARTDAEISPAGRFLDAFPLWDGSNRLLISWSPCRLIDGDLTLPCTSSLIAKAGVVEASPLYGIWIYDMGEQTQLPVVLSSEGVMISEIVATQGRSLPTLLPDKQAGVDLDATAAENGMGILHIRSVYDFDGVDTTASSIANVADPLQTTADQRSARFLRIIKAVSMPDRDFLDLAGSVPRRMREIIGYAPIEPDGSVMVKVPANVSLSFEALDNNGRRIGDQHAYWLQFQAGETITCNGCHEGNSDTPHGRSDATPPSVNVGAVTTGIPFPNTEPDMLAEMGESMAQTRMRISCATDDCAAMLPTVEIIYEDSWTDPAAKTKDASFSYLYSDLDTTSPATSDCETTWSTLCRTVINYETVIHPLWSKDRQVFDINNILIDDNTCTTCHNIVDSISNLQIPAAQLDLSNGPSTDEPDHFKAYRELLIRDTEQEEVDGILQDILVQDTDNDGNLLFELDVDGNQVLDIDDNPIPVMVPVLAVGPSMAAGAANNSDFFSKFDQGGSHAGQLTPAELKLLSEWIDIGAQYYNNPFDAPVN
jgi:hypothetical protein